MSVKNAARVVLIVGMLTSIALVIAGNVFPLFSMDTPASEFSTWKNCKSIGGLYGCYIKFSSPAAVADCSEMDDRTTTVGVFSLIWMMASLQTIFLMVWELCGGTSPLSSLPLMLFGWTAGVGVALTIMLCQTLIATLCNNPLSFSDQSGKMKLGGMIISSAAGTSLITFLFYLVAPNNETIEGADKDKGNSNNNKQKQQATSLTAMKMEDE